VIRSSGVSYFEVVLNISFLIFAMSAFSFSIFSSVLLIQVYSNEFLVNIQLLKTPNKEEVVIKVEAKNVSYKIIKIVKNRLQDFKWDSGINSLDNYIIEIERYENGEYNIFSPSADIDLIPEKEEYIPLQNGESIIDTFQIKGYLFSRYKEHGKGFPTGMYRLKVYFNPNSIGQERVESCSKWIEFKIE
jgi:hypothetical protein